MTEAMHPEIPDNEILPNFQDFAAILKESNIELHPSEVHGVICGILCKNMDENRAKASLFHTEDIGPSSPFLHHIYESTYKQLHDFTFELNILLPDDEEPLTARAEALTAWCQGFITGLTMSNVPIENRKPSELTEAIDDLIEIAKMNYEAVVASEEDETAYVELVEYARMAAILIYQELQDEKV